MMMIIGMMMKGQGNNKNYEEKGKQKEREEDNGRVGGVRGGVYIK